MELDLPISFSFSYSIWRRGRCFLLIYYVEKKGDQTHGQMGIRYILIMFVNLGCGLLLSTVSLIEPTVHRGVSTMVVYLMQFNGMALSVSSLCAHYNIYFNVNQKKLNLSWKTNLLINSVCGLFFLGYMLIFFFYKPALMWIAMSLSSFYPLARQLGTWYQRTRLNQNWVLGHIQAVFTAGIGHLMVFFVGGPARYTPILKNYTTHPIAWVTPIVLLFLLEKIYVHKNQEKLKSYSSLI